MKNKILYTASKDSHILHFHIPYLKWFKENGYEVHVAINGKSEILYTDVVWDIPFQRSPFDKKNKRAYDELKKVIDDNNYALIHCHTPMASVITRLAARESRKKGTKVLYTAHGFHFYKGAPLKNWLTFYPIEKSLSKITDAIITINKEDYNLLYSKNFYASGKFHINGIGIDSNRLNISNKVDIVAFKKELGFDQEDIIALYLAEFIDRKNHQFLIESFLTIKNEFPNVKLLFLGRGELEDQLKQFVKNNSLSDQVFFMGFRNDIGKFISITDIGLSSSKQEGLGLGVAEMMFNGIPVIISEDRGHKELVQDGVNGLMYPQEDQLTFINHLKRLIINEELRKELGEQGKISMEKFTIENSLENMIEIYKEYLPS